MPIPYPRKSEAPNELRAGERCLPLQAMDVRGRTHGILYSAMVCQTFLNDSPEVLEAIYIFPLPPKAAVHGFILQVGERVIKGDIQERRAARLAYHEAKNSGHRAALLEEERSDIFTLTVGNIAPSEQVTIQFEIFGCLESFGNHLRLRIPLVVGEIYVPGKPGTGPRVGRGEAPDTDRVPDASRITPPRLSPGSANPVHLTLGIEVNPANLEFHKIGSQCHFAKIQKAGKGFTVELVPGLERLKRAFVLDIELKPDSLQTNLLVDYDNKVFALTVVPPASETTESLKRDVVILLDRSGSMSGWNLRGARRAVQRVIEALNEADRFSLVLFNQQTLHLDTEQALFPADGFHKQMAFDFLENVRASGGTEMLTALQQAQEKLAALSDRRRHIILITDGQVADHSAILQSCQEGVTVSTVGIGHACEEGLLQQVADKTGGLCTMVSSESALEADLLQLHRSWGSPVLQSLCLSGEIEEERAPFAWDLWPQIAGIFFGRFEQLPKKAEVTGTLPDGRKWVCPVEPVPTKSPVVHRTWARNRLLDLGDRFSRSLAETSQLVELSLYAQVLCPFTAFVAIDRDQVVDLKLPRRSEVQPVEQTNLKGAVLAASSAMPAFRPTRRADEPPVPKEESAPSLADQAVARLRQDHFLLTYEKHPRQTVEKSIEIAEEFIKWLSILLLESRIPASQVEPWKALLAAMLEYHTALESIVAGAAGREAMGLRRKVAQMVRELSPTPA